jgi:hypothetical protein
MRLKTHGQAGTRDMDFKLGHYPIWGGVLICLERGALVLGRSNVTYQAVSYSSIACISRLAAAGTAALRMSAKGKFGHYPIWREVIWRSAAFMPLQREMCPKPRKQNCCAGFGEQRNGMNAVLLTRQQIWHFLDCENFFKARLGRIRFDSSRR